MWFRGILVASFLLLGGCSSSEEDQAETIDYASYDLAGLKELVRDGERGFVVEIIRAREKLALTDADEHLLSAKIYISVSNAIAADVELEKAKRAGASSAEYFLLLTQNYILQARYNKAEEAIGDAELEGDDAYQGLLLLADINKAQRNFDAARKLYQAAIVDQPENYLGYIGAAQIELTLGRLADAARFSEVAKTLAPNDPKTLFVQGAIYRYQLQTEKATEFLERSIELNKTQILPRLELVGIYTEAGAFDKARTHLDVVYATAPNNRLAKFYTALMLAAEGKPTEAEEILIQLGDLSSAFPLAGRVYGHTLYRLGKFSKAQFHLERFLELVPTDRPSRLALAEIHIRRGRPAKSLDLLSPLLGAETADFEAILQAAAAAASAGNPGLAEKFLERAQSLVSSQGDGDVNLGRKLARRIATNLLAQGKGDEAVSQLRNLMAADGQDYVSLSLLSNVQMSNGDLEGALKSAERMLELAPNNPLSSNLMGAVKHRQRNWAEAKLLYDKAIDLSPDYLSALKNRGQLFLALEEFEEARADLAKVVAASPEEYQSRGLYGRALLETGHAEEALEHFLAAERAYPQSVALKADHAEALEKLGYLSSAISKAKEAQALVNEDSGFGRYLAALLLDWEKVEVERQTEETAARADAKKERDDERKMREERLANDAVKKAAEAAKEKAKTG
ncbi:MAG: hypothetical protein COB37_04185 [Kordiimonadales bacterium]|nr:MAG: hypothetical protein COB37_04185 [Kordiimonadales bacterium]